MSISWISKPGAVTLVTSLTLHAAAAVFIHGHDARHAAASVAKAQIAVDLEPPPVDEATPETPRSAAAARSAPARVTAHHGAGSRPRAEPAAAPAAPTPLAAAPAAAPARFVLATPVAAIASSPSAPSSWSVGRASEGAGTAPFEAAQVSVPARLLARAPVVYPSQARAQEIETDVRVEIVIDALGHVVAARSLAKAGYGLDDAAEHAIRLYRFSPAVRDGRPVSVRMRWTVQFRLG